MAPAAVKVNRRAFGHNLRLTRIGCRGLVGRTGGSHGNGDLGGGACKGAVTDHQAEGQRFVRFEAGGSNEPRAAVSVPDRTTLGPDSCTQA